MKVITNYEYACIVIDYNYGYIISGNDDYN